MVQRVEDPVVKAAELSAIPGTHITERENSCKLSFDFFTQVLTVLKQRASFFFFLAEASCSREIEHSLVFYCCVTNEPKVRRQVPMDTDFPGQVASRYLWSEVRH